MTHQALPTNNPYQQNYAQHQQSYGLHPSSYNPQYQQNIASIPSKWTGKFKEKESEQYEEKEYEPIVKNIRTNEDTKRTYVDTNADTENKFDASKLTVDVENPFAMKNIAEKMFKFNANKESITEQKESETEEDIPNMKKF